MSTAISARPSGLGRLTKTLFLARMRSGSQRWLAACTIVGFTITTWLALTVVAGVVMFIERYRHPAETYPVVFSLEPDMAKIMGALYVLFALFACALMVVPIASLASTSARLGANSTERRLAILRLIGLSSRDVERMTLMENAIITVIGIVLGVIAYAASVPLWQFASFQNQRLTSGEMLLPAVYIGLVGLAVLAIATISSWFGLQRVRITPLGVARRSLPKPLKAWRLIAFVLAIAAYSVVLVVAKPSGTSQTEIFLYAVPVFVAMIIVIAVINLVVPWLLQIAVRILAHLPGAAWMRAMRRIAYDPRAVASHQRAGDGGVYRRHDERR
ncbi:ABC transporter permease [Nanchangia anserum]|uniref:FtsX-like permease family protein n=1 Tax=Nanchangia anserum TaxID=2692125 RepID=UPI00188471EF|nr:ABC transporter permease [Nanchangia anserum]QOX81192.1 ABC transporter permease [Nanchangia anserum]